MIGSGNGNGNGNGDAVGPAGSLLLVEENHDLPIVRLSVTTRVGGADDPDGREGLAYFAAELGRRAAGGRSRAELDVALESLGAELDVHPDFDSVTWELEVLSRNLLPAAALLADVILRPDFPEAEAAQLRRELHAGLDELRDDDASLARRFFARRLFGRHPYGRPLTGTDASIDRLTAEAARRWMERAVAGKNLIFCAVGDVARAEAEALFARRFGVVRAGGAIAPPPADPAFPSGIGLEIVDKPERTQSQIVLGHPAPKWGGPDWLALSVAATAFGGTFTARLMTEVRVKRGLSYGASARLGQGRGARALSVVVFPSLDQTPETLALVLRLWREWTCEGLTDEEIDFARGYLASSFAFHVATPEDRADFDLALRVCELPADWRARYAERVRAVTAAEVREAMARRLRAGDLAVTIVSTASELGKRLAKRRDLPEMAVSTVRYDSY